MIIQNFHSKVIDNACPYLPIHISWPFWLCYTLLWMCCQFFVIYVILSILWETFVWLVNLDENIVLQNSIQIVRKNTLELVQNSSYSVLKVLTEKTMQELLKCGFCLKLLLYKCKSDQLPTFWILSSLLGGWNSKATANPPKSDDRMQKIGNWSELHS